MTRFRPLAAAFIIATATMGCAGPRPEGVLYGKSNLGFDGRDALIDRVAFEFNCEGPFEFHLLAWAELFSHAAHQVGVRGCGKQAVYQHVRGMFFGQHAWSTRQIDTLEGAATGHLAHEPTHKPTHKPTPCVADPSELCQPLGTGSTR